MKTLITFAFGLLLTSCTFYETVPPRYDYRQAVIGEYDVEEYSDTYDDYTYYPMEIRLGYSSDELFIHNFYGLNRPVVAYVNQTEITIPYQVIDGYEIQGSGHVNYDELHLQYSVYDRYHHSVTDYCDTQAFRLYP